MLDPPESIIGLRVLGHFRVEQVVVAGTSSVVFDATDERDGQPVAVKVVRPESCDREVIEQFASTMESVGDLDHPNVQKVLAWGRLEVRTSASSPQASTALVIVSERLNAGSLRDLYDRGRRLSPSQALALGLDVCRGLDHLHRRGFVHGELSPAKLIFGRDRRVRIVDVGISSLLAERMWTDPASVPTHMARYAAPEQAEGTTVAASDVYALCLTLIEGVTGEMPFVGDSTLATLQARVGRLMPVSAELGPLAAVLERAGRPEAEDRATAAQFGRALMRSAEKLPRPEPLPLLGADLFDPPTQPTADESTPPTLEVDSALDGADTVAAVAEEAPTAAIVTAADEIPPIVDPGLIPSAETDELTVLPPPLVGDELDAPSSGAPTDAATERVDAVAATGPEPVTGSDGIAEVASTSVVAAVTARRGPPRWVTRALVPGLIVAAIGVLVVIALRLFMTPSYEVPDLTGLTEQQARVSVEEFGWDTAIDLQRSDDEPRPGHVIRTVPGPGERLSRGEPFLIVVSEGPEFRTLPILTGLGESDAVVALDDLDLIAVVEEAFDEEAPVGSVVRWTVPSDPTLGAGGQVLPDTEVVLIISLGPAPRTIPDLFGTPETAAIEQLRSLGLEVQMLDPVFDDTAPAGTIATQSPAAGDQVERGSVVQIAVSRGPDLVVFPDLSGTDFAEAQARLAAVDLVAQLQFGASDGRFVSATIDGQRVTAGQTVRRFSTVAMVFL